jgi:hypothetical protein
MQRNLLYLVLMKDSKDGSRIIRSEATSVNISKSITADL